MLRILICEKLLPKLWDSFEIMGLFVKEQNPREQNHLQFMISLKDTDNGEKSKSAKPWKISVFADRDLQPDLPEAKH